jgi:hypothetical protein
MWPWTLPAPNVTFTTFSVSKALLESEELYPFRIKVSVDPVSKMARSF